MMSIQELSNEIRGIVFVQFSCKLPYVDVLTNVQTHINSLMFTESGNKRYPNYYGVVLDEVARITIGIYEQQYTEFTNKFDCEYGRYYKGTDKHYSVWS